MRPLFKEGDFVLVKQIYPFHSVGDCIVYNYQGKTLLHRVIGVQDGGVFVQDDGQIADKHFVPSKNIIGKVISSNPLKRGVLGYFYFKLKNLFQ